MRSCNELSQSDILNGYIGMHNLAGGGVDSLLKTHMTCAGCYEIEPPTYKEFI